MLSGLYIEGTTLLHRTGPGKKILSLVLIGTGLFFIRDLTILASCFAVIIGLYFTAGIPAKIMLRQLRPAAILLVVIFIVQYFSNSLELATLIVLRFACLILAASLITLTTRTSDMVEGIERGLKPLHKILPVERVSLTISLCIRFIPTIQAITEDVKEAQYARGLSTNIFAIAVPVIIRTLKMADEISEAIYARSFETEPYHPDLDK